MHLETTKRVDKVDGPSQMAIWSSWQAFWVTHPVSYATKKSPEKHAAVEDQVS